MLGGGDCESRTSSRAANRAVRDGVASVARAALPAGDALGVRFCDVADDGLCALLGLAVEMTLRNCGFEACIDDRRARMRSPFLGLAAAGRSGATTTSSAVGPSSEDVSMVRSTTLPGAKAMVPFA
jgi:hypothetical protein